MKIWCISDTHGLHDQLIVPDNLDMIIHAGDISNSPNSRENIIECQDFLNWYENLKCENKFLVPGNHDVSFERNLISPLDLEFRGITSTIHGPMAYDGPDMKLALFGSAYTPTYGNWSFMKPRHRIGQLWEDIPTHLDILITHGPPRGVLDLSYSVSNVLEYCGDTALYNRIVKVRPKYHIFGHIHNFKDCRNQGSRTFDGTTYINASCVTDAKFGQGPSSNGVIIDL